MRIPEEGLRRYAVLGVLVTLLSGVFFGLAEGELGEAGNWLFALVGGVVFAGLIVVIDRVWPRR